jgi:Ca2+-binding RTX toxin-like protein
MSSSGVNQWHDLVLGTGQNDIILAQSWNWSGVYANGQGGDDYMVGTRFDDTIIEGAGNGWLTGGQGNDILTGGSGSDRFYFSGGDGNDHITDMNWTDHITFQNVNPDTVFLVTEGNKMTGEGFGYAIVYGEEYEQSVIHLDHLTNNDLGWIMSTVNYTWA